MTLLFLIFLLILNYVDSARILCVFQMPAVSHQRVFQPIWRELSLRGHEVIVVTPKPLKDPSLVNLTEIDVGGSNNELIQRHGFQFFMNKQNGIHTKIPKIFNMHYDFAEAILKNDQFIKIYNNTEENFDVVIAQTYISPILYSLAAKFRAPLIGVSSMGAYIGSHFAMGNPNPPSLYSEMFLPYNGRLTFYERLKSSLYYAFVRFYRHFVILPKSDELARRYLGNDLPYMGEIEGNMSLLLLSTNPFLSPPRSTIPTIISLESIHVKPVEALPRDLQTFLDESKEGVVYFSLGSNVQSINIPERVRNILVESFAELPYKILWKFESDTLPNQPKNVIIKKWLPQKDVLAHPNVKVFLSQCGLQSTEEAVSRAVPIVAIPFIADQEMNAKRLSEDLGVAIHLDFVTFTKQQLTAAIIEVAENPKYKKNMERLRDLWTDQPMKALDRAMWWIEYVIRHKGTKHLRSPTADISWIEYLLLDVIAVIVFTFYAFIQIIKLIFRLIFNKNSQKKKQS
ncbi:UDP-glucosyltransferase 2-like isoform X1 [Diorhabda carinulata]|uniref:UDP-glucosyltransferase 2-like isoform X1 n=1 Tax=Diorhabda carinulata TaxID=1163345 RepID=UPI0025A19DA3|nr:UDP-glucosyltransferase 2-like isoform X1 [Diorhabda carinulata]